MKWIKYGISLILILLILLGVFFMRSAIMIINILDEIYYSAGEPRILPLTMAYPSWVPGMTRAIDMRLMPEDELKFYSIFYENNWLIDDSHWADMSIDLDYETKSMIIVATVYGNEKESLCIVYEHGINKTEIAITKVYLDLLKDDGLYESKFDTESILQFMADNHITWEALEGYKQYFLYTKLFPDWVK